MAIDHFRDAHRLMPEDAACRGRLGGALIARGRALFARGKRDEAIAAYGEAVLVNPEDAIGRSALSRIHSERGKLLFDEGKDEEALVALGEAIRINPNDAAAHHLLGRIRSRRREREAAIAAYAEATRLDGSNADAHLDLARELLAFPRELSRDDQAVIHARRAAEIRPNEHTLRTLVEAEYRAGHWDELSKAIRRSMGMPGAVTTRDRFLLALAYSRKGDRGQAEIWLKLAADSKKRDLDDPEVRSLWSEVAKLLGQPGPSASGTSPRKSTAPEKPR
jgi:tetratricopeptide (TPR) repeat protein